MPSSCFWTFVQCALPALMVPASQTCRRLQCFSNTSNTDVNVPWGVDCSMGFKATRAQCSIAYSADTQLEVFFKYPKHFGQLGRSARSVLMYISTSLGFYASNDAEYWSIPLCILLRYDIMTRVYGVRDPFYTLFDVWLSQDISAD